MDPTTGSSKLPWITAYCDGGSRGNPGPSGYGVFIQDESGKAVAELSEFLGKRTNNYAEYSGLLASLDFALQKGHSRLRVVSDSELMVKQIKGQYKVNSPELRPLYDEAKQRIARLEQFRIEHVLRGKNQQADRLANLAMDRGMGGNRTVVEKRSSPPASKPAVSARTSPSVPDAKTPGLESSGLGRDFRAAVKAVAQAGSTPAPPAPKVLTGLVKGGVIHLLSGDLPEGTLVRVTVE